MIATNKHNLEIVFNQKKNTITLWGLLPKSYWVQISSIYATLSTDGEHMKIKNQWFGLKVSHKLHCVMGETCNPSH